MDMNWKHNTVTLNGCRGCLPWCTRGHHGGSTCCVGILASMAYHVFAIPVRWPIRLVYVCVDGGLPAMLLVSIHGGVEDPARLAVDADCGINVTELMCLLQHIWNSGLNNVIPRPSIIPSAWYGRSWGIHWDSSPFANPSPASSPTLQETLYHTYQRNTV